MLKIHLRNEQLDLEIFNMDELIIAGDSAKQMAEFFGWPCKEPKFSFTKEKGFRSVGIYGSYDSGMIYEKDGFTFEWEWYIGDCIE